jgi:hypothetical protein
MPMGKGTYGSQKGRPSEEDKKNLSAKDKKKMSKAEVIAMLKKKKAKDGKK